MEKPVIGVICDHNAAVLAGLINQAGYRALRTPSNTLRPESAPEVDAWVVDCDHSDEVAEAMQWLEPRVLALSNRPEVSDPLAYRRWCERVILTLDKWTGPLRYSEHGDSPSTALAYREVRGVWLLAGSTGAPNAVRRFLASLTRVPPVAFVYAQHIHHAQQSALATVGTTNRALSCYLALGRHWLNCGHVLIVPATARLRFSRYGEVTSSRLSWQTPETPNIDQVMLEMCGMQPAPAGAIIFSGAGLDGIEGLGALSEVGTKIWAQDPATCEAPSMPGAAVDAGLASLIAPPEQLASELLACYPAAAAGSS